MPDSRSESSFPELTSAQRALLSSIPGRFPVERIDRLWIFPAHMGKRRETGLFVLSLLSQNEGSPTEPPLRAVVTLSYEAERGSGAPRYQERVVEEGWAPPERIDRIIAGVLARSGAEVEEPMVETIAGEPDVWMELVDALTAPDKAMP